MALKLSFLSAIRNSDQGRRLVIGYSASVAVHVLVMLIQFTLPERFPAHMPSLDVILVNTRHNTAPKDPQALAQANLEGGGDSSEKVRATSPLLPQENMRDGNDLANMTRGQQPTILQPQFEQVLTQQGASVAIARPEASEDKPTAAQQPVTGTDARNAEAMDLQLQAEIAEKTRAYNLRPRSKKIAASTQEFRFAQYIASWRTKAERIGELNYPAAARGKLYGDLGMRVIIKKDGTVKEVAITRHSKHPVLDEAAMLIVRRGEPYAQFPPDISRDWDEIEIHSSWKFTNDKLGLRFTDK